MKKAIKVLEKRIEILNNKWDETDNKFNECEMISDYEFLKSDMQNIELEVIELHSAIKILNDNINTLKLEL